MIVFGTRCYGYVDRVPGLCYVATQFAHLNYLPLFPIKTFVVAEGSEEGNGFRGFDVGLSAKSVLAGYARGWSGVGATVASAIAGFWAGSALGSAPLALGLAVVLPVLAVISFFIWSSKWWVPCQLVVHAVTLSALLVPGRQPGDHQTMLMWVGFANGFLLLYSLTRVWDQAGRERAVELVQALGLDRETAEEVLDERAARPWRKRAEE